MLIALSRQYGAGGSSVARSVAERLGWELIDNQLIEAVAERAEVEPEVVAECEERAPSFVERLARVTALQLPELFVPSTPIAPGIDEGKLVRITRSVVEDLAQQGRCVFVGRACAAVLPRTDDVLHVRLVAPEEFRRRHAIENLGVSANDVLRIQVETDAARRRYLHEYYDRDVDDPLHYDLVVNTGRVGIAGAAELILTRAGQLGWLT